MWKIWINRPYRREIPYFYLSPSRSLVKMTKGLIYSSYRQICPVKAMVFPVVMYGCESWTRKKAEPQRIDALELGCWRRLLRVPWTARRSNQSILKEISPGCSLEGLMLQLKLQYFGHLMRRADMWKDLDDGKEWGQEEKGTTEDEMVGWHHQSNGHEFGWTPGVGDGQGGLACCSPWGCKESDTAEWLGEPMASFLPGWLLLNRGPPDWRGGGLWPVRPPSPHLTHLDWVSISPQDVPTPSLGSTAAAFLLLFTI